MQFAHARTRSCAGMAISCVDLISIRCMRFFFLCTCNQFTRFWKRLSWISAAVLLPTLLLQQTITGTPAGRGRSSSHSWLHSWLRSLIGCHSTCSLFSYSFGFRGFVWWSIVFRHVDKNTEWIVLWKKTYNNMIYFLFKVEKYWKEEEVPR